MAYLIHIESATKSCSVALSFNGALKQIKEITSENFSHGENLTLFIEECLKNENITVKQLNAISISSGPGSYTGLRIGVSVAKGLCYALEIPLIAIPSLVCIYEGVKKDFPSHTLIPMIDARRMEVYTSVFGKDGEILKEVSADVLEEHSYERYEPFVACGDGAEKCKELWSNRKDVHFANSFTLSAQSQVELAFAKFKNQEFENVAYLEPFYLKEFIAGVKKNVNIPTN